jgi:hypothetical protein
MADPGPEDGGDGLEDIKGLAWIAPPPPAPGAILASTTLFDQSAFTPEELYPPGRVRRPVIPEKAPNVTVEPTKTVAEMFELVDMSVPPEFTTPLVPCPDNAEFEQEFLRGKSIPELLAKLK